MNQREFEFAMKRGLGRCILELEQNDNIEKFRDIVLKGCLNNYSYDAQCEGTRSRYMYVLQSKYQDSYFEDKIIEKFHGNIKDLWLFDHLANMLYLLADDGSQKARTAMLEKYNQMYFGLRRNTSVTTLEQFEWLCVWLVTLEGFTRFQKIVLDLADFYEKKNITDFYSFDWFWACSKEYCDEKRMKEFIFKNEREGIMIFYNSLDNFLTKEDSEENNSDSDTTLKSSIALSVKQLIEDCNKEDKRILKYIGMTYQFARFATKEQIVELANTIINLDNCMLQAKLMRVFWKHEFPLDVSYLIDFAENGNKDLCESALSAMEIIKNTDVKEYAYQLIREQRHLSEALVMLFQNYEKQDNEIILKLLKKQPVRYSDGIWHHVFNKALDWLKNNPEAPQEVIYYLYEHTLCSQCRESIVKFMIDRNLITDEIGNECRYDSNADIQETVKVIFG